MDEYRPYPTDQPNDSDENEENEETAPEGEGERPAPPPYRSEARMSARDEDDDEEDDDERDEDDDEEGDEERPARSGGRREERGDRGERATPNLDHPGGHLTGTVARLNRPRRFGFLRTDDGMEIFFHASALESGPSSFDQLRSGQAVEFDCHQDEAGRGLAASLVQVVGPPPAEAPRQQRQGREEGQSRGGRGGRGERGARENWRVEVLQERGDTSVRAQLERLLNERNVKPGNLTLGLLEGQSGTEVWVAYYVEEGGRRG